MRVLAVTTWLPTESHPSTGAFVVKDARAIAGLGHDVALVHLVDPALLGPGEPLRTELGGLPVTRIPMAPGNPAQAAVTGRAVRRLAAGADLVHSMAFPTLLAMAWWRPAAPWVHTEHWSGLTAPQTLPTPMRLALPGLRPLLARPDVVTAVCDYLAEPVRRVRGGAPTVVVPCIVPVPDPLVPRPEPGERLRLVDVGALVPRKDPVTAVDTLAELRRRGRMASLRLVGQGPLAGEVTRRARTLGVAEHVRLAGTLDREGVLAELGAADVFLGPTLGDNFFVACAEALAAGRPVVVGATGGQGEYIRERTGRTVDEQTPTAYADAVEEVLRASAGLSAGDISATVGPPFSADRVAAGYQAAYDLAVRQRRRRATRDAGQHRRGSGS